MPMMRSGSLLDRSENQGQLTDPGKDELKDQQYNRGSAVEGPM